MKHPTVRRALVRKSTYLGVVAALALASGAAADGLSKPDALNMVLLGHNDMQNRPIYQPTVHVYPASTQSAYAGKILLFAGLHNATGGGSCTGSLPNPLNNNVCEPDGTLIVDVTQPTHPVVIKHLPPANPNNAMAQMVRVCDGKTGVLGQTGHVYMLRSDGSSGGNGQHDLYDVTDPLNPVAVSANSVPIADPAHNQFLSGLTATHKSWWECETGIAWIVAGADGSRGALHPDNWNTNTNQHIKVWDLSDPANPRYIRDLGLVGQNPNSTTKPLSGGVHGPYAAISNPLTNEVINRVYMPYGTSSQGVMQIVDRHLALPANYTTSAGQLINGPGGWDGLDTPRAQAPTDADLTSIVVGSLTMTPTEGAHSACPVYNIPLKHFKSFTSYTTRDYIQLISEETDNHCNGAPHFGYLVDATRDTTGKGAGGISGEMRPMVVSTMQVFEDSAKPDYCTRGTRFGTHSCNEALASVPSTFFAPDFGKLTYIAYFDGGARAFDIRDPYHPQDVAHYVAAVHPLPFGEQPPNMVNNVLVHDVSHNNLDEDSNGLIYSVDRVGYGMDILKLTGPAEAIRHQP